MTKIPTGKMGRAFAGGRTVARAGGNMLGYYAKRPFLSGAAREKEKADAVRSGARTLFSGLSLLKGTALKMAQQLSLEMDMLPEGCAGNWKRPVIRSLQSTKLLFGR